MADIILGAYFIVAQRVRKARISPEPCDACLRATLNARKIALEGTVDSEAVDFERPRRM